METWALLVWLLIGGLAGYFASKIMGKDAPYGVVGDVVLGLIGSVIGGYLLGLAGLTGTGGLIGSFIVALLGAMLLLWLVRQLQRA